MSVNHQRVLQIIHDALRRSRASSVYQRLVNARQIVIHQREDHGPDACNDMDLVAADHYFEARLQVVSVGSAYPIGFMLANIGHTVYEAGKLALTIVGQRDRMDTGVCPTSPSSLDVIRWARAGARNGLRDCRTNATVQNMQLPSMSDISITELSGW